jgi:hypothetical protein
VARLLHSSVENTGEEIGGRCCQQNRQLELGQKRTGSPENVVSNYLSGLTPTQREHSRSYMIDSIGPYA